MSAATKALIVAIPSPPLPLPSPPIHTSPTYAEAPLGYKAPEIRLRAASSSTHHLSEIPSPPLFEVGESSSAAAARQARHTLAHRVDYEFVNTVDASIRAVKSRGMTAIGEDAQDDRALLRAQVSVLTRERRYFRSMASFYKREAVITRQAWSHSESRIQAMEALIRDLQRDVDVLPRQRIRDEDRLTSHIQHEHNRFRELVRTTETGPQDGPADAGSSC
ncbi:hypothetical protein Tco_0262586 [Tanacetum coccineum]